MAVLRAILLLSALACPQGDAEEEYERRAAELKPEDVQGHYELGAWCHKQKLWHLALREYESVLKADPDHAGTRRQLGYRRGVKSWDRDAKTERLWKYRAAVSEGVRFPLESEIAAARRKGKYYSAALDFLLDLDKWVEAVRAIDDRTGLFDGKVVVELSFRELGGPVAQGGGSGGRGRIRVDLGKFADQVKRVEQYERMRKVARVIVPPSRLSAVLTHELAHCFQGAPAPAWFQEGMPTYCAQDAHFVGFYRHERSKVGPVGDKIEEKYTYARGWAFFEYLESAHGREKVAQFLDLVIRKRKPVEEAAEEATGLEWEDLVAAERKWSKKWIRGYKIR